MLKKKKYSLKQLLKKKKLTECHYFITRAIRSVFLRSVLLIQVQVLVRVKMSAA